MENVVFYHGGVEPTFTLDQLDILRKSQKQQKKSNSYVGFYMYGEENRDGAFHYAEQQNEYENTTTKGVIELKLDNNLKIYDVPPFSITRITEPEIIELQQQGYDLIRGKSVGKEEYVLLNKDKVQSINFIPMSKRYDYTQYLSRIKVRGSEAYGDIDDNEYNFQVRALQTLDDMFVYYDKIKNQLTFEEIDRIYKTIHSNVGAVIDIIPDSYKRKIEDIDQSYKPFYQQRQNQILEQQQEQHQIREENERRIQEETDRQKHAQEVRNQEAVKAMQILDERKEKFKNLFPENERTTDNLREMLKAYNHAIYRGGNISIENLDRMYENIDLIDQMIEKKEKENEQEKIGILKKQISAMNIEIEQYIDFMKPYMVVPKVNEQITKLIAKNDEINSSEIIDSITDFQRVVEIKQELISYLEEATNVIKKGIEQEQSNNSMQQQTVSNISNQPIAEEQMLQSTNDDFWDEFMKPESRPNRFPTNQMLDKNGLFTMEFIAFTMEENPIAAEQMLSSNKQKIQEMQTRGIENNLSSMQNPINVDTMIDAMANGQIDTNGQPIISNQQEQHNAYTRTMGFTGTSLLALVSFITSFIIAIVGIAFIILK